jgi:hypothetical protein
MRLRARIQAREREERARRPAGLNAGVMGRPASRRSIPARFWHAGVRAFPDDPRDAAAWDRFWGAQFRRRLPGERNPEEATQLLQYVYPYDEIAYHRWIPPGGTLVLESELGFWTLFPSSLLEPGEEGVEEAFERAGFLLHLADTYRWYARQWRALTGPGSRRRGSRAAKWCQRFLLRVRATWDRREAQIRALRAELERRRAENETSDWERVRAGEKLLFCVRTR